MKIFRLKIKAHNQESVEKVVVETDIAAAVQGVMDKVSKHAVTNITITPLGEMPDTYVAEKFLNKKEKVVAPYRTPPAGSGPPF